MKKQFVALDRDGTLIKECHYLSDPDLVELLPGAVEGLRRLSRLGLGLIVITNQSAIGRGYFDEARLAQIHQRLVNLLTAEHIHLDGIYFCPHIPTDHCRCRKPEPGMLEQAIRDFEVTPEDCFMVGDKVCDIELGQRVGLKTFLVRTGYGAEVEAKGQAKPDYVVDNLLEMAQIIETLLIRA